MAAKAPNSRSPADQSCCASLVGELRKSGKLKFKKRYSAGALLFREGEEAHGVYVLSKGRVKISVSSSEGKTLAFRIAKAGELLGLSAGFTGRPYEATAQMLEDGCIEFISRELLIELMSSPHLSIQLLQVMSDEFCEFMEHARLLLLSQSAAEKLARLLLKSADESVKSNGCTPRMAQAFCDLTHDQIAELVGSSRETVSRVLAEFRRQQMITSLDHAICVENRAALQSVARCSWTGNLPSLIGAI